MRRAKGALEAEVLAALWASDEALSPEEVRQSLSSNLAYTTIMTILVRLYEKGILHRERRDRAYVYSPLVDAAGIAANQMIDVLQRETNQPAVLSRFVATLDTEAQAAMQQALDGSKPKH